MRMRFGSLVVAAGVCGVLSFACLATSLGTEYWYIIQMNGTDADDLSSHSGLWSISEDGRTSTGPADGPELSEAELHMLHMHSAIVVLLPLSLILMLFGGICGLVSAMARSPLLLSGTASYFFICSLLTLCGVSLYIVYSHEALAETERLLGPEGLAHVCTSFGWSLGLAWFSYGLELLTGALLLTAARTARRHHSSPTSA